MQELNLQEIEMASGGDIAESAAAFGIAYGVGVAAYGASWGAVGVGLAFVASPITAVAITGLAFYGGYLALRPRTN
jgi:apolipoprotein N-acyltransferase